MTRPNTPMAFFKNVSVFLSRWAQPSVLMLLMAFAGPVVSAEDHIFRVDHTGFTLWLDCIEHGALRFRYNAQHDSGNLPRQDDFRFDPKAPPECQPFNTDRYQTVPPAARYQRGHLVPANHLDHSEQALRESFYLTNILPQTATLNNGAWLATEEIIECYRDIDELLVISGVVWGRNEANDYFLASHGIKTPDRFWKVVIRGDGTTIAWLIPNNTFATRDRLDRFLISPIKLEGILRTKIPEIPDAWRRTRPRTSWPKPVGCNLS